MTTTKKTKDETVKEEKKVEAPVEEAKEPVEEVEAPVEEPKLTKEEEEKEEAIKKAEEEEVDILVVLKAKGFDDKEEVQRYLHILDVAQNNDIRRKAELEELEKEMALREATVAQREKDVDKTGAELVEKKIEVRAMIEQYSELSDNN